MTCCIFQSPASAAFFGFDQVEILEEAARYLRKQLTPNRVIRLAELDGFVPIQIRCTPRPDLMSGDGFFLEVSLNFSIGEEIHAICGETYLAANTEGARLGIIFEAIDDSIDTYLEIREDIAARRREDFSAATVPAQSTNPQVQDVATDYRHRVVVLHLPRG
ncbi:hypothetical protein PVT71_28625 (plasmid) [Salipiger sp. H15]|uniref:PilZ domain-containing protein n=1 Tax=Alloyangia sp. H15 TaxID=3029062 RepID=A0AAU8ATZ3_9RHOB